VAQACFQGFGEFFCLHHQDGVEAVSGNDHTFPSTHFQPEAGDGECPRHFGNIVFCPHGADTSQQDQQKYFKTSHNENQNETTNSRKKASITRGYNKIKICDD
jgi:hypothetical protein